MPESRLSKEKIFKDANTYYKNASQRIIGVAHLNFSKKHAGKKILDFGCATGDYCLELKKFGFECVGVDINEEYIKIAREKEVDAYIIEDQLPFSDNSFDTVILIEPPGCPPRPSRPICCKCCADTTARVHCRCWLHAVRRIASTSRSSHFASPCAT